jgi:hypothetical protein
VGEAERAFVERHRTPIETNTTPPPVRVGQAFPSNGWDKPNAALPHHAGASDRRSAPAQQGAEQQPKTSFPRTRESSGRTKRGTNTTDRKTRAVFGCLFSFPHSENETKHAVAVNPVPFPSRNALWIPAYAGMSPCRTRGPCGCPER